MYYPFGNSTAMYMYMHEYNSRVWSGIVWYMFCDSIYSHAGRPCSQVALRWCLQKDIIPSVVLGVKSVEQLEANVGAAKGWTLSPDQMALLDEVSEIAIPPTYRFTRTQPERLRTAWKWHGSLGGMKTVTKTFSFRNINANNNSRTEIVYWVLLLIILSKPVCILWNIRLRFHVVCLLAKRANVWNLRHQKTFSLTS